MAWAGPDTKCPQCKQTYTPMFASGSSVSSGCPYCKKEELQTKEEKHFTELDALSMEERVRRVEKWIYNYKPPRNIRDIKF